MRVPRRVTTQRVFSGLQAQLEAAERAVTARFTSRLAATEQQTIDAVAAAEDAQAAAADAYEVLPAAILATLDANATTAAVNELLPAVHTATATANELLPDAYTDLARLGKTRCYRATATTANPQRSSLTGIAGTEPWFTLEEMTITKDFESPAHGMGYPLLVFFSCEIAGVTADVDNKYELRIVANGVPLLNTTRSGTLGTNRNDLMIFEPTFLAPGVKTIKVEWRCLDNTIRCEGVARRLAIIRLGTDDTDA